MSPSSFWRLGLLLLTVLLLLTACQPSPTLPPDGESTESSTAGKPVDDNPYPVNHLTVNGEALKGFVISYNGKAGGVLATAAKALQKYLKLATGVQLPIRTFRVEEGVKRFLIDETTVSDPNDFRYYSDSDGIVLAGSARRSALYCVYRFLEEEIGWRFFTADTEVCYETDRLDLKALDESFHHTFAIRDIYVTEYFDEDISVKRYQNGEGKRRGLTAESLGGHETFHPNGIHTLGALSETDETRQPCLNDEEIYQTVLRNTVAWLRDNPNATHFHISQNDNRRACTCQACETDLTRYGSPAGALIEFVNRLAEELLARDLDVTLITFAYDYTFPCPRNITCHDNVAVELCTITYCFNHAFDDPNCAQNAACMKEIRAWSRICDEFYIWDYTVNFKYYLCPFPNFDVLRQNMKVLSEIGANGLLVQGNFQTVSGEFGALRCYLLAKLMEEPAMSQETYRRHRDEFLAAYYGAGWENVADFLDEITAVSNRKNSCFGIYASPEEIYGPHPFAADSDRLVALWDEAEALAERPLQKKHVRQSRLSCDYLRLGAIHQEEMTSGDASRIEAQKAAVQAFFDACVELKIGRIAENCPLPQAIDPAQNPRAWWNLHEYRE